MDEVTEGGTFQGSGQFTLSSVEAWKRLQHSLPCTEYWVLKLLQAASRWGSERFCVSTDNENITIDFDTSSPTQVEHRDLLAVDFKGTALQHLRVALAGACGDPKVNSVELVWTSDGKTTQFLWADGDVEVSEEPSVPFPRASFRIQLLHQELSWFKNIFGQAPFALERDALQERARLCSIPILIDNELLEFGSHEPSSGPLLAKSGPYPSEQATRSVEYRFHRHLELPRYMDWTSSNNNRIRPRHPYGSHTPGQQADRIVWLVDGVIIDEWFVDNGETAVAGVISVSADDLTLDLSGFGIRRDAKALARIAETRKLRRELLQEAEHQLASLLEHEQRKKQVYRSVLGIHLVVGILFPPYLLGGLVELFRLPRKTKALLKQDLELCRTHTRARLELLSSEEKESD